MKRKRRKSKKRRKMIQNMNGFMMRVLMKMQNSYRKTQMKEI
jgi:hypothetical protein